MSTSSWWGCWPKFSWGGRRRSRLTGATPTRRRATRRAWRCWTCFSRESGVTTTSLSPAETFTCYDQTFHQKKTFFLWLFIYFTSSVLLTQTTGSFVNTSSQSCQPKSKLVHIYHFYIVVCFEELILVWSEFNWCSGS